MQTKLIVVSEVTAVTKNPQTQIFCSLFKFCRSLGLSNEWGKRENRDQGNPGPGSVMALLAARGQVLTTAGHR